MNRNVLLPSILILALLVGLPVLAAPDRVKMMKIFATVDFNHDGFIDGDEANQHHADHFATADSNGDGNVSREEHDAAMLNMRRKMRGDPAAKTQETMAAEPDQSMMNTKSAEGTPGPKGKDMGGRLAKHFGAMDDDEDGSLSKAEFMNSHDKHFLSRDRDGDGKISVSEFISMHNF